MYFRAEGSDNFFRVGAVQDPAVKDVIMWQPENGPSL